MEPVHASLTQLVESSLQMWYSFTTLFLTGPTHLLGSNRMTVSRAIPRALQADYRLLQLPDSADLAAVRTQYRTLVKHVHPDTGGYHADFLALQRAYERVIEDVQTRTGH